MTDLTIDVDRIGIRRRRLKSCSKHMCSVKTVEKRLPITKWLPKYNFSILLQDIIAGITVGLTAIPQGIAYAVVAGLSPEYGLYAALMGGFVYLFFGSCKDLTIGPTAILSALVAKYVSGYSADFAILTAFLAGLLELTCGVFHLGFLVEFISVPVINGFTTAAAIQICASQLKSLFGLSGSSGNYFFESVYNFIYNIKTAKLWDPILGFSTIGILIVLKIAGQGCNRSGTIIKQMRWFLSLARNAVVVIVGIIVAYILKIATGNEPLTLIGEIESGLPKFSPPPFSTTVGNETLTFVNMLQVLGPQSVVVPFVAIMESVAIGKAFSEGKTIDASQEMIALGLSNIVGSFVSSMPMAGSFSRTALNNASGVQTPAGGIFTGLLIILALSLLTSFFYYIPKPTLAAIIITAMYPMIDYKIFGRLWKNTKSELVTLIITIAMCLCYGLEYGIITGIFIDAFILIYKTSRPKVELNTLKSVNNGEFVVVPLTGSVSYCAAEHIRRTIIKASSLVSINAVVVVDATNLQSMDSTVASNLMSVVKDLDRLSRRIIFINFNMDLQKLCTDINPNHKKKFLIVSSPNQLSDALWRH